MYSTSLDSLLRRMDFDKMANMHLYVGASLHSELYSREFANPEPRAFQNPLSPAMLPKEECRNVGYVSNGLGTIGGDLPASGGFGVPGILPPVATAINLLGAPL